MSKFSATDPALGYLYQLRTGLLWSLKRLSASKTFFVSVETLDDITFESPDGIATDLIQTKLHRNEQTTITNASVDLWKTLRVWIEGRGDGSIDPAAVLHLLTTASAPAGTIASYLRVDGRNERAALAAMETTSRASTNRESADAYRVFRALGPAERRELVSSILVIDRGPDSELLEGMLRCEVYWSVDKAHLDQFLEHLEGWWFRRVIKQLVSHDPSHRIAATELELRMRELRDEWKPDGESPNLHLPAPTPSASTLHFSSRATTMVGRDRERDLLAGFVERPERFAWWLVIGPGGSGKSRLALELCHWLPPAWKAGFLGRDGGPIEWSRYRPRQPTLIVIDYVASRAAEIGRMVLKLGRSAPYFTSPMRVLLLEREEGTWRQDYLREDSDIESSELAATKHAEPLKLTALRTSDLYAIASELVSRAHAQPPTIAAFARVMRALDPLGRPLFGMIAGQLLSEEQTDLSGHMPALRHILRREAGRWRTLITNTEARERLVHLVTLATLVGGIRPRAGSFTFLRAEAAAALLPDVDLMDPDAYSSFVGAPATPEALPGLQPDILGERFVLDRFSNASTSASAKRLIAAAWTLQRHDASAFLLRAVEDFLGDTGLDIAVGAIPLEDADSRAQWGNLVCSIMRVADRSEDALTQKLLARLRLLAHDHVGELELRNALANAEFVIANILQFSERRFTEAAAQYARALTIASPGSEVAAAATNNRGILNQVLKGQAAAFSDFTSAIEMHGATDEARACAMNNRADVFAERGDHEAAIRDRTAVLALRETTYDRRYIALTRRSQSLVALGRYDEALRDLDQIQATDDILPEQKTEARLDRGVLLRGLGQYEPARSDLESVLDSDAGMHAVALVELAELARIQGDAARAGEYLQSVETSPEVSPEALVQVFVVRARALADRGDLSGAEDLWREVHAHPHATNGQKRIAASHLKPSEAE